MTKYNGYGNANSHKADIILTYDNLVGTRVHNIAMYLAMMRELSVSFPVLFFNTGGKSLNIKSAIMSGFCKSGHI